MLLILSTALQVIALTSTPAADALAHVPADAYGAIAVRPEQGTAPTTGQAEAGTASGALFHQFLTLGAQLRLLPAQARVVGDIVGCLPLLGRYPCAFALLDITSRPLSNGGYRLNDMQAVLVFETNGDHEPIAERIRQLLAAYTNAELSRLDRHSETGLIRYRLTDSRLPPWAIIEWAAVEQQFVVAIGQGALDRALAVLAGNAPALANDGWTAQARRTAEADVAFFEWMIAVEPLRTRLGEVVQGRPEEVLRALGAESLERVLGTIGTRGRAVTAHLVSRTAGADQHVTLCEPAPPEDPAMAAIPTAATRYVLLRPPIAEWIRAARAAWLASQHVSKREGLCAGWARLEQEYGFRVEEDLLAQLGTRVIIHDYPPHPLRIPLLWTVAIEVDGDSEQVRRAIEGMLRAWQAALVRQLAETPDTGLAPQLQRTGDGLWFLRLGLAGPAIGLHPRWVIVGFSPEAVRRNLVSLHGPGSDPPAGQPPVDTPQPDR
ncbi:MAG: hypothetical protein JXA69_04820 [Phycisphaerae bacterium]|nr:hypothetical protein [Phycisphaerae bacterium]